MWKYICLKTAKFYSSKLVKKLLEDNILFTFPHYEAQMKSKGFSSRKKKWKKEKKKPQIIIKLTLFLKGNCLEHQ